MRRAEVRTEDAVDPPDLAAVGHDVRSVAEELERGRLV